MFFRPVGSSTRKSSQEGSGLKVMERSRPAKVIYMPKLEEGQVDLDDQQTNDIHKQVGHDSAQFVINFFLAQVFLCVVKILTTIY